MLRCNQIVYWGISMIQIPFLTYFVPVLSPLSYHSGVRMPDIAGRGLVKWDRPLKKQEADPQGSASCFIPVSDSVQTYEDIGVTLHSSDSCFSSFSIMGNRISNVAPPEPLNSSIDPPCPSNILFAMARPRP